ncbi:MAG: methyltransferase family protein [Flavisolibacter sp.]
MKLAIKSLLGLINLALMMCLAIFLPAGTIHYIEAWYYLLIFFAGVLAISIYIFINDKRLLQSRLKAGAAAEKRLFQKWVQGLASVGFLGMYLLAGFDHRFQWSHVPSWLIVMSDVMVVIAMLLFFIVFRKNSYLSAVVEVQKGQRVINDGPYGVVRHPMYSGALVLFAFSPLGLASFWALVTLPLMILVLVLRSLDEEKALKSELPGYSEYCRKVRYRLIPWIF